MAINAILMRDVAPSAMAAVVIGSRRNRWQAIHSVLAPPSSAARACAGISAMGARPSMAIPISVMPKPVILVQCAQHVVETAGDPRSRQKCSLDGHHVFQAARGDECDNALLLTDRPLPLQSVDGHERSDGGRLGPDALGFGEFRHPTDQRVIGMASPTLSAAVSEPDTSAAAKRGTRSIQPIAFNSSKPFHMPYRASP